MIIKIYGENLERYVWLVYRIRGLESILYRGKLGVGIEIKELGMMDG